jgi:hypothetical protein
VVLEHSFCKRRSPINSFKVDIQSYIFTARSDISFLQHTLPALVKIPPKEESKVSVILDTGNPSGVLGSSLVQCDLNEVVQKIEKIQTSDTFNFIKTKYDSLTIQETNRIQFGCPLKETHCFRGYPIYGSFKQFIDTDSKYILHLDCDMIFYEDPKYSWIKEGMRIMEENQDILCVLPKGGPPTKDGILHQGTTQYNVDKNRGLHLFKNFTSRHYLIHRERFLSLLPLKPLWLSWREPIKSRFFRNGKMLCWETMVEHALEKSDLWRADLMTEQSWSLHPGDRSQEFYQLLPQIIDSVNRNEFPEEQRGHFDLRLSDWKYFLN